MWDHACSVPFKVSHESVLKRILHRIKGCVNTARTLLKGGITLPSLLLYPIRRRMPAPRNHLELKGGASLIGPPDEPMLTMVEEIWAKQCYLPPGFQFRPGQSIVDVGANIGVFAVWAATLNPQGRVFSVEPSPRMFRFLRDNVSRNKLNNLTILQAACAGKRGQTVMYSRGSEVMNTLYTRDNYGSTFSPSISIKAVTLADVFERFGIDTCDLLKLDCEGAEYEILFQSKKETLRRIANITMEYHLGLNDHTPGELAGFLESHGFSVQWSPPLDVESGYLSATRPPLKAVQSAG
jgi:FkbM family methyltransferase